MIPMTVEVDVLKLSDSDLSPEKIVVNNSGLVRLQYIDDPDGILIIAETGKSLPLINFPRVYRRYVVNPDAKIGYHAHKETEQYIFCACGSFILHLDDGNKKQDILMDVPYIGVRLGQRLWHSMSNFVQNSMILVHASSLYDESDYIRDYQQFLKYTKSGK